MLTNWLGRATRALRFRSARAQANPLPTDREAGLAMARDMVAQRRFGAAEICLEHLLERHPDDAEIHNETGALRYLQGDFAGAEAAFRAARERAPRAVLVLANLGQSIAAVGRFAEAVPLFETALAIEPNHASARYNLAIACAALGDTARAIDLNRSLISADPDDHAARFAYADCLLRSGRYEEGWREYEGRLANPEHRRYFRHYPQPQWDGCAITGATLLIWPEQGLGDTLQFLRLALLLAARHPEMRLLVEVQAPLHRLVRQSSASVANLDVLAGGLPLPPFTHHVSIMSLPHLMHGSLDIDPKPPPYLRAGAEDARHWRERVDGRAAGALRVGLVWAGSRREAVGAGEQAVDARRSAGAEACAGLLEVPGCAFFNLQIGPRSAEMAALGRVLIDFTAEIGDFADSAALIDALDLVISVDTAVVHLAGALDKPVWMLSRFDCCWRWGERRPAIPWYPRLRPFYQAAPGDWPGVIDAVKRALTALAAAPP